MLTAGHRLTVERVPQLQIPFQLQNIPPKSVSSNFLTTTAAGRYWIELNLLEVNLTINSPTPLEFPGLLTPPPPLHPSGISNSLHGGGMDIFWNHTLSIIYGKLIGILVSSVEQGCKIQLNIVWYRVGVSESQQPIPTQKYAEHPSGSWTSLEQEVLVFEERWRWWGCFKNRIEWMKRSRDKKTWLP